MTTRFEGAGAKDTSITIHKAGEEIGADVVPEGKIALAFNYDEVFYVQGTPDEVGALLVDALARLEASVKSEPLINAVTELAAAFKKEAQKP